MKTTNADISGPMFHPGNGRMDRYRFGQAVLAVSSTPSPARPDSNQDAVMACPVGDNGIVLAVADGCGGMPSGDRASAAVVRAVARSVAKASGLEQTPAVLNAFDRANSAVSDLRVGAGSTLTIVLVTGLLARVFHAGDSPAAVIGQRGKIRFATVSHSLVGYGVEAGLLSEDDAMAHEDSGVVLNVLGFPEMFVHVGPPVRLRPMDTVLVASDGLTDNLTFEQISGACRSGGIVQAHTDLVRLARDAMDDPETGHADDLSVLLYRPRARRDD